MMDEGKSGDVNLVTMNEAVKCGGTTLGSMFVGGAIGSLVSPIGTVTGAVIGGITGFAGTVVEIRSDRKKCKKTR